MKASFIRRMAAYIIDFFIVIIVSSIVSVPFSASSIEYIDKQDQILKDLSESKITVDEFLDSYADVVYGMDKVNLIPSLIFVIVVVLYFGPYQFKKKQTIGKKVLKIEVGGEALTMNMLLIRSLLLYNAIPIVINSIFILFVSENLYLGIYLTTTTLSTIFMIVTVLFVAIREDKKGLHDIITKTQVVIKE